MATSTLHEISELTRRERVRIAWALGEEPAMAEAADKVLALRDAIAALGAIGVEAALIGGVAVGIRSGQARATVDTDLAVPSHVDRSRVTESLISAGFSLRGEFAHSLNFRHPSGEPVQLVVDPTFDAMIDRAQAERLGDLTVRVVTTADLIEMKERAGRDPALRRSKALRDAADAALLRGDVPEPDEGW